MPLLTFVMVVVFVPPLLPVMWVMPPLAWHGQNWQPGWPGHVPHGGQWLLGTGQGGRNHTNALRAAGASGGATGNLGVALGPPSSLLALPLLAGRRAALQLVWDLAAVTAWPRTRRLQITALAQLQTTLSPLQGASPGAEQFTPCHARPASRSGPVSMETIAPCYHNAAAAEVSMETLPAVPAHMTGAMVNPASGGTPF